MPITWRNVDRGRGFSDAALIMRESGRSLNKGFDQLGGVIDDAKKLREDNFQNEKSNNTNAAKDLLASFNSVEDLEAAQASGDLERQLADLGPNVDRGVVRDGFANRQRELRDASNAEFEFDTNQAKQEAAPLEQQFYKHLAANEDGEAQKLIDDNAELFGRAGIAGKLQKDYTSTNRQEVIQNRQDKEYNDAQVLKGQNKSFDEIRAKAVQEAGTGAEAHALAVAWAEEEGIPASVYLDRLQEVQSAFGAANSMTPDQVAEHNEYAAEQAAIAESMIKQEQALYNEVAQRTAIDPAHSYSDPSRAKMSEATTILDAAGWDAEFNAKRVNKAVSQFLKENKGLKGRNGKPLKASSPEMAAIVKEAVTRLGSPESILPGKNNVDADDIKTMLTAEFDIYTDFLSREQELQRAKDRLNDATSSAKSLAASNTGAHLDAAKNLRRLLNQ